MKQLVFLTLMTALFVSCGNSNVEKKNQTAEEESTAVVYSVDELYARGEELEGQEITVKGTVMHVCKQGGGRCFLMGSNEDFNIRIEAGEKIGAFSQEQMGSELTITGIFKQVRTEADAHNPASEHANDNDEHNKDAEEAHRTIMQAQAKSDQVYFIEGIEIVNKEI